MKLPLLVGSLCCPLLFHTLWATLGHTPGLGERQGGWKINKPRELWGAADWEDMTASKDKEDDEVEWKYNFFHSADHILVEILVLIFQTPRGITGVHSVTDLAWNCDNFCPLTIWNIILGPNNLFAVLLYNSSPLKIKPCNSCPNCFLKSYSD